VPARGGPPRSLSKPRPLARWNRYYNVVDDSPVDLERLRQFDQLEQPTILRWADGLAFRVIPGEQLSRAVYVSGTYEPSTLCLLRELLEPGDVFLDAGAHVGLVSLAASRWVARRGKVYSLEPSEREFRRLLETIELSDVRNVVPVRAAVSSTSGQGFLRVAGDADSGLNTLGTRFAYEGVEVASVEQVETTTLDDFIEAHGLHRVAGVKLDVEGAEAAALAGAERLLGELRPALIVEILSSALGANGSTADEIFDALERADYRVYAVDDATAQPVPLEALASVDGQNVLALPRERAAPRLRT